MTNGQAHWWLNSSVIRTWNNHEMIGVRGNRSICALAHRNRSVRIQRYRTFSCDVMLSSNMAASIAVEINIHLCKHLSTLLCVTGSPWTSPFVVQAHNDRVRAWCTWLPWISRSVCAIQWQSNGQHDVSDNTLQLNKIIWGSAMHWLVSVPRTNLLLLWVFDTSSRDNWQ